MPAKSLFSHVGCLWNFRFSGLTIICARTQADSGWYQTEKSTRRRAWQSQIPVGEPMNREPAWLQVTGVKLGWLMMSCTGYDLQISSLPYVSLLDGGWMYYMLVKVGLMMDAQSDLCSLVESAVHQSIPMYSRYDLWVRKWGFIQLLMTRSCVYNTSLGMRCLVHPVANYLWVCSSSCVGVGSHIAHLMSNHTALYQQSFPSIEDLYNDYSSTCGEWACCFLQDQSWMIMDGLSGSAWLFLEVTEVWSLHVQSSENISSPDNKPFFDMV